MNQLGMTLAWLTVQVAVVLLPALGLQALASRRGPGSGAWVATLSLGLVVVLGVVVFFPWAGPGIEPTSAGPVPPTVEGPPSAVDRSPLASTGAIDRPDPPSSGIGLSFDGLRRSWARMGRRAAEPAERFRGWGKSLAIAFLVGAGLGSFRLLIGLWAVGLCRRSGRAVEDPAMIALVDELRNSMDCRADVELLEVPDLTTPATAGWRRPMLLLPDDWRSWDESERRAVVAHELAHILRGDYAAGLLARVAVVLNYHHPLVRRMAGRLQLEQELAADAMGARFAGGRTAYLVALSSLALKQDGRSPSWPARAFLPARGTLIRRIAMLRNENETKNAGPGWSNAWRLATALGLLALTAGVATLKGPARASDESPSPAPPAARVAEAPDALELAAPFDLSYVPDRMNGVVAFRPAALVSRPGMGLLTPLVRQLWADDLAYITKELKVETSRPGFLKLGCEEIESIVCGFRFGQPVDKAKNADGGPLHSIEFGGLTVRAVDPFDWLAFLRQWKMELQEVRRGPGVCCKIGGPIADEFGYPIYIYLPDDRTLVCGDETWFRESTGQTVPRLPAYLRGADWERVSRGLLAVAINNRGGSFAKDYDLGRPDDAVVLECFKGVERWVLGVASSDAPALHAEATAIDPESAALTARSIDRLAKLGLASLGSSTPDAGEQERALRIARTFLANLKVWDDGRSVVLSAGDFGTFVDVAAIIKAEAEEDEPKARAAKAKPKTEKR